jgi:superkiller protein 3
MIAAALNVEGIQLLTSRNYQKAETAFREAIRLDPSEAEFYNGLGVALVEQDKLEEAIAEYRQGIRIDPSHAMAHGNLGLALQKQGKREEAIAELRMARDLFKAQGRSRGVEKTERYLRELGDQ